MLNLLWFIYITIDAISNWYVIEKKNQVPDYLLITIIRGMAAILFGGLIIDLQPVDFWTYLGFTMSSFWLFFDPLLNTLRRKSFFYIGTNAQIDKFGLKYPISYWSLKVAALVICIISLIILIKVY